MSSVIGRQAQQLYGLFGFVTRCALRSVASRRQPRCRNRRPLPASEKGRLPRHEIRFHRVDGVQKVSRIQAWAGTDTSERPQTTSGVFLFGGRPPLRPFAFELVRFASEVICPPRLAKIAATILVGSIAGRTDIDIKHLASLARRSGPGRYYLGSWRFAGVSRRHVANGR
jgi:hypothetical protein